MSCELLWHSNDHYLYKCNHNISCTFIDPTLYICNSQLLQTTTNVETIDTTSVSPEVNRSRSTTSLSSTTLPMHTSTEQSIATTTASPRPSTTTNLSPTSTQVSQTTQLNLHLNLSTTTGIGQTTTRTVMSTTTHNQLQNLTTSPTFIKTTTPLSSTTTPASSTISYNEKTTTLVDTTTIAPQNYTYNDETTTTYRPTTTSIKYKTTTAASPTSTTTYRPTTTSIKYKTTTAASPTSTTTSTTTMYMITSTTVQPTTTVFVNSTNSIRKNLRSNLPRPKEVILWPLIFLLIPVFLLILYIQKRNKKKVEISTTVKVPDEPLDPVIEQILEKQDLENQLRINQWRMAKLHKYLEKKKYKKKDLVENMEKNATLMEKINIQIKNSPVFIYKKRGKKKETIPTMEADLFVEKKDVPTMKVDLMTALKEPEKVKHISSVAKLKIKMLPVEYEHRRKRKNFKPLKDCLLPVKPRRPKRKPPSVPKGDLEMLHTKKLVSNSVFKKK